MSLTLPTLCLELPYQRDSSRYFESVQDLAWPVFLDSANTDIAIGRYDIIAADPFITLETRNESTLIHYQDGREDHLEDDPFLLLQQILQPLHQQATDLPFSGGAIGYFSYDLGRRIEPLPAITTDAENIPEMTIGIYDWAVITDHKLQRCWLASFGLNPLTEENWPDLEQRFRSLPPPAQKRRRLSL